MNQVTPYKKMVQLAIVMLYIPIQPAHRSSRRRSPLLQGYGGLL